MKNIDTSVLQKNFGRAVRFARKRTGISQENAADLAGLDRSYFGAVERGEHNVSLANIHKICIAIGVSVQELFQISDSLHNNLHNKDMP